MDYELSSFCFLFEFCSISGFVNAKILMKNFLFDDKFISILLVVL